MSSSISDWIGSFFQPSTTYQRVGNNSNTNIPGSFPTEESNSPLPSSRINSVFNSQTINSTFRNLSSWLNYLLIQPLIIIILIIFRILSTIINVIYFQNQSTSIVNGSGSRDSITNNNNSRYEIVDPVAKASKFIRDLEDNLQPPSILQGNNTNGGSGGNVVNDTHSPVTSATGTATATATATATTISASERLPPFFQGSYTQALYMATKRGKFLFVYLTNPHNENANGIFNNIITNEMFLKIFQTNENIIIWGGDLTNPEAYQLANSLAVTKFPFLGLLCLTRSSKMTPEGPRKTASKLSLVSKIQGNIINNHNSRQFQTQNGNVDDGDGDDDNNNFVSVANELIKKKFLTKITKYSPELNLIRQELQDKYMSQILLKQQELNYQKSLQADKLKKQQKQYDTLSKQYLIYQLDRFEKYLTKDQTSNDGNNIARIAIKLTNGTRVTGYFPSDNSIEDIFIFVELINRGYLNPISTSTTTTTTTPHHSVISTLTESQALIKFKNFKLIYKFKLLSPLPPKICLNDELSKDIIMKINQFDIIYPNGLLIVEDIQN
ncbi:UBX domain-containing protein, putative [Candida dubliniensis CD36]|uniref:UBX domain-containing protein, putative n=1 Tax=Candida dubliniensis (strain CD36 / ATCC MYA-646 / CBS 7987 / NCPF 3949 / NRRL Y-17841) TaxID=573826 RepID=B9WG68_CANDC|nr:UBX domain-containing protein, putative [Candida dubliniensis CD36]CAX42238.1 UBX domain-containing protein, putative [Candida dubliniensis CD36]